MKPLYLTAFPLLAAAAIAHAQSQPCELTWLGGLPPTIDESVLEPCGTATPGLGTCPLLWEAIPIDDGDTIAGSIGQVDGQNDWDWFRFDMPRAGQVQFVVQAQFAADLFLVDADDCMLTIVHNMTLTPCVALNMAHVLDEGEYLIWIAHPHDEQALCDGPDGIPDSGDETNNYVAELVLLFNTPPCSPADLTTQGAADGDALFGVPDEAITGADIGYYVNAWIAGDLAIADVTTTGAGIGDPGYGDPDGQTTAADISYYVNIWIAGCP